MPAHEIIKTRHELRRRTLTATAVSSITPRMRRIEFTSPDLHDFISPSPDDHIKIFLPAADGTTHNRDFTPRAFDPSAGTLILDFALHESGPATTWAAHAQPGDTLEIGGPRGSSIVPDDFDWYLMIGDAAALPSFTRRLESLRAGVTAITVVALDHPEERQTVTTQAHWTALWPTPATLRDTVRGLPRPAGEGFVWIAAETADSRDLHHLLVKEKGHPAPWVKASAYWTRGEAG